MPKSFDNVIIIVVSDKLAPPGERLFSYASQYEKADISRPMITFYKNFKVTQWPWSVNLTLRQHCSPVRIMPNTYMAKITVKMLNPKC